jgi:hypothetical protein
MEGAVGLERTINRGFKDPCHGRQRGMTFFESSSRVGLLLEIVLFRKPASPFGITF